MGKGKTLDLTQGKVWKVLIAFILPIMLGSLIQQLYTMVDAIIVGKFVGRNGLAAIDSVGTLFKFPLNFLSGLSSGTAIVISGYFGSRDEEGLDHSIHAAFTIAVVLGVICSIIGVVFAPALLRVMSVPQEIFDITLLYVRIFFGGLWAMFIYNMAAGMLRAFGDSKSGLYVLIACCLLNIVGDILLVKVFNMGVAGAAIATIIAQMISAIYIMRILGNIHTHCGSSVWKLHYCPEHTIKIVKLGLPLGLQAMLFPIANSIIHAAINKMGVDAIAAWSVCGKLDMFIWLIADAMSPALSTYVAQNLGAKKNDRVNHGVYLGAAISAALVGLISLALFCVPGQLGGLFITQTDAVVLVPYIVRFMRMMAPFYIFYSFAESFSGACCGLGDTIRPMIVTMICTCGLRVVSIFAILPRFNTMDCIVWIYIASWIVTGLSFIAMFIYKKRNLSKAV